MRCISMFTSLKQVLTCKLYFTNWGDFILQILPNGAKGSHVYNTG